MRRSCISGVFVSRPAVNQGPIMNKQVAAVVEHGRIAEVARLVGLLIDQGVLNRVSALQYFDRAAAAALESDVGPYGSFALQGVSDLLRGTSNVSCPN